MPDATNDTPINTDVQPVDTVPAVTAVPDQTPLAPDQQTQVAQPAQTAVAVASDTTPATPAPSPVADPTPAAVATPVQQPAGSNLFEDITRSIIQSQENIIGPIALMRAQQVEGLTVDWANNKSISISGDPQQVIDNLVSQYQTLFGQISVEVCKDAAARYLSSVPAAQLPASLR